MLFLKTGILELQMPIHPFRPSS